MRAVSFCVHFHRFGKNQAGELANTSAAFDHAKKVRRALAFAAETGTGDVQVLSANFLFLHAAAVIHDDDWGIGEDGGQSDVNLRGFGVPGVVDQLQMRTFAGSVAFSEDSSEAGINAEGGRLRHSAKVYHRLSDASSRPSEFRGRSFPTQFGGVVLVKNYQEIGLERQRVMDIQERLLQHVWHERKSHRRDEIDLLAEP
ncbi:MAG: hypothetical protein AAB676_14675 [Verrucomicrobiota bacterium]